MNKEFEQWLKQDDLYEYFLNNPEQQKDIFNDFQKEKEYIEPNSKNDWIEWFVNNPELAKKHYPLQSKELTDRIKKSPPYETANIIQKLPEYFYLWKEEIEKYEGSLRKNRIIAQIKLLNGVLNEQEYSHEIEQQSIESVREELTEQMEYWERMLDNQTIPIVVYQTGDKQCKSIKTGKKDIEHLSDLIVCQHSADIVERIKVKYKNIKGKRLKLLLLTLQELELLPKERIASRFYKCCKNDFNWEIASYTAMNDYAYNKNIDTEELDSMKKYLKSIINSN